MRVLVVEDEKRIADFLSRGLQSAGYAVDVVNTGGDAIERVHTTEYDLVVLDLGLPDVDGLQVLQKIKNRKDDSAGADFERARFGGRPCKGPGTRR